VEDVRPCAEQGDAPAQCFLGPRYDYDEGVTEDYAEAVRWYRLAAEQGNASAQAGLGLMYASGMGVPEDLVLAYMWLNLAAAQGKEIVNETARELEDLTEARMTRDQIAEAQRLSREWIEAHRESPSGANVALALELPFVHRIT
jgi:TPR repeat protein